MGDVFARWVRGFRERWWGSQQPIVLQSQEEPQNWSAGRKLLKFMHVTGHSSGPQVTVALPQLPPPVHRTSHFPVPQTITPSLHEPPLPQEMVQSPSKQLTVVPWQAPLPSQLTSQGHPGGQFKVCRLHPPPLRH